MYPIVSLSLWLCVGYVWVCPAVRTFLYLYFQIFSMWRLEAEQLTGIVYLTQNVISIDQYNLYHVTHVPLYDAH